MSSRLSNLPENSFLSELENLAREMDDFKTAQLTSGRSGVISYAVQSANTWDYTGTVGSDSDGFTSRFSDYSVTFTGDGSQSPVIANLSFAIFVNGTDSAHQLTPQNNTWQDGSNRLANITYFDVTETATSYTQTFELMTQKAITVYVKVYAVASSPGTVSAARTS